MNEAYNTLRDPFSRAEYLLALEGGPTAGEQKQMPPAFLAEMLEAREQIEESRAGCPDDAAVDLRPSSTSGTTVSWRTWAASFAALQALPPDDAGRARTCRLRSAAQLNAAKYVRGLIRDLNAD